MAWGKTGGEFAAPTGDTKALEPQPDTTTGFNFPYRGTEQHGVAPVEQTHYTPSEKWALDEHAPDYEAEPKHVEPVAVRIVQESSREFRSFSTGVATVDATVRMIAGRNDHRTTLRIRNTSATKAIYIGTSMVNSVSGFPIAANASETLYTEMEVYAISEDGSSVNVAILAEFRVEA